MFHRSYCVLFVGYSTAFERPSKYRSLICHTYLGSQVTTAISLQLRIQRFCCFSFRALFKCYYLHIGFDTNGNVTFGRNI